MNYSKWNEQFDKVLANLDNLDSKEAEEAWCAMLCWAQNGCPNPEPSTEECARIYSCVMSSLDEQGLSDKPFYKDVYNIKFSI
jgi:hypothetical protein